MTWFWLEYDPKKENLGFAITSIHPSFLLYLLLPLHLHSVVLFLFFLGGCGTYLFQSSQIGTILAINRTKFLFWNIYHDGFACCLILIHPDQPMNSKKHHKAGIYRVRGIRNKHMYPRFFYCRKQSCQVSSCP